MIVAIEGLPGAGKTTCTRLVSAQLGWPSVLEPYGDHPFLGTVYREAFRHNLLVETQFLLLHFAEYRGLMSDQSVVSDFAPAKDLVFADLVLRDEDHRLFTSLYGHFYEPVPPPALTIFLDSPPAECLHRVNVRGREFERNMRIEWLYELRAGYMQRLGELGQRVEVLDLPANVPTHEVAVEVVNVIGDGASQDDAGRR
jgi:deoxyguanosine kinase